MISEIRNIDCMIGMSEFPDKFFDLAIVDPPYGIGVSLMERGETVGDKRRGRRVVINNKKTNNIKPIWDIAPPPMEYFDELFRVSKNQIIWGGNYFNLPPTRCIIFWDKMQPFESFSQFELGWTSFSSPAAKYTNCNRAGIESKGKIHPTQKPVALYKWLLTNYAKQGDKILDTHLGSGSSRIAAHDLGFDFWGFELDKDYFEASEARFKKHISQMVLPLDIQLPNYEQTEINL